MIRDYWYESGRDRGSYDSDDYYYGDDSDDGADYTDTSQFEIYTSNVPLPGHPLHSSMLLITSRERTDVIRFLDENQSILQGQCDELKMADFFLVDWFRKYPPEESSQGKAESVARVVPCELAGTGKHYVLKEYSTDPVSMRRWRTEVRAYHQISLLHPDDRKYFAELVSFGSLDLMTGVPGLYLLFEYIHKPKNLRVSDRLKNEMEATVGYLLNSVGVEHNIIKRSNYRLQLDEHAKPYIKVFGFSRATFWDTTDDITSDSSNSWLSCPDLLTCKLR